MLVSISKRHATHILKGADTVCGMSAAGMTQVLGQVSEVPLCVCCEARTFPTERVHLTRGGYDVAGRYWGTGAPLYRVEKGPQEGCEYVRAFSAPSARKKAKRYFLL